jgi:truncated hemoglobin YjbI
MREEDLALFLDVFDGCIENPRFLDDFYDTFLSRSDEVRAMFANTDFAKQKRALKASLYTIVASVARRKADFQGLEDLGERHRQLKIESRHYEVWLDALAEAAARCSAQWDGERDRVFREGLRAGIDFMIGGV